MSDSPDAIRADIERTRGELGADVDALADKVNPAKAVQRQTGKVRNALGGVRDRVMGAADDAGSSTADVAHQLRTKAEGNPLAVGLIAFGAGLLVSSLFPASEKERELADAAKEKAQPLIDEATGVAKEVANDLKEPAQDAAAAVKDRAQGAVDTVKAEATDAADTVKSESKDAADSVRSTGQG